HVLIGVMITTCSSVVLMYELHVDITTKRGGDKPVGEKTRGCTDQRMALNNTLVTFTPLVYSFPLCFFSGVSGHVWITACGCRAT
uniref:Uncharacterized protein n=1 Tax=Aegilops tauschii subsp. strangulata TaxID=200361 RepID=A0A452ZPV1_AEGTS